MVAASAPPRREGSPWCSLWPGRGRRDIVPRSSIPFQTRHRRVVADPRALLETALADRYRVERELGHGGMATVYLARDLRHDRPVALKVLRPELAATLGPERFQREIRFAARLQHPQIGRAHV